MNLLFAIFRSLLDMRVTIINQLTTLMSGIQALSNNNESLRNDLALANSKLDQIILTLTPPLAVGLRLTVTLEGVVTTIDWKEVYNMNLNDVQKSQLSVTATDTKGAPAVFDGKVSWASSDETVATVVPGTLDSGNNIVPPVEGDESNSNMVLVANFPGACRVTASADGDLGEGVRPIKGVLDVQVGPSGATTMTINAGPAVDGPTVA